jgi:hypothetical protein
MVDVFHRWANMETMDLRAMVRHRCEKRTVVQDKRIAKI